MSEMTAPSAAQIRRDEWLDAHHPKCTNRHCAWPDERCLEMEARKEAAAAFDAGLEAALAADPSGETRPPAEPKPAALCRRCNGSGFIAEWDGSAWAGEGCPDCDPGDPPPLTLLQWAQERHANSKRIAALKTGADRLGWLEDCRYWNGIVAALKLADSRERALKEALTESSALASAAFATIAKESASQPADEASKWQELRDSTQDQPGLFRLVCELQAALRDARGFGFECPMCGFASNTAHECPNDGATLMLVTWKHRALSAAGKVAELTAAAGRETRAPQPPAWTCFHCGETFTEETEARDHFGADEGAQVACRIGEKDGGLLKELRALEKYVAKLRRENEQLDHEAGAYRAQSAELERLFGKGATSAYQAWLRLEEMESRATAGGLSWAENHCEEFGDKFGGGEQFRQDSIAVLFAAAAFDAAVEAFKVRKSASSHRETPAATPAPPTEQACPRCLALGLLDPIDRLYVDPMAASLGRKCGMCSGTARIPAPPASVSAPKEK